MLKTFSKIFPLFDYIYLFQIMEYDAVSFSKWCLRHPTARNLQKKHTLVWTRKTVFLFFTTLFLLLITDWSLASGLGNPVWFLIFFFPLAQFSPVFIISSQILLSPLETYQKHLILKTAQNKRNRLKNLRVVAITGSFGKTSTKDILYTLLWKKLRVVKTPKSFNTPLGISQTIREDLKDNTEVLIAEVGAYKIGEIKKITQLIKPDISIITAVAHQHLERFGSIEKIAQAKFELAEGLDGSGVAILNKQYEQIIRLTPKLKAMTIFYGTKDCKYFVKDIKTDLTGTSFKMVTPKGEIKTHIPLIGAHHAYNFLAASAAALQLGMSLTEIKQRAEILLPTPHRMEVNQVPGYIFIDNSFNSNLESAKSAFKLLSDLKTSQKIVVTPGLIELGEKTEEGNKKFIKEAAKVADKIIIVGESNKNFLLSGLTNFPKNRIYHAASTHDALILVSRLAQNDTAVLMENDLPDQYL